MSARTIRTWMLRACLACAGVLLLASLIAPQVSGAAEIHWRTSNFNYVAQDKPLKDFIRDFAASQGLNVVVAPEVEGTVNGKFDMSPKTMLDTLAMSFALTWFYDGSVLYVSQEGDMSTEVVQLHSISAEQLQLALTRLGIADDRYPISYDRAQRPHGLPVPSDSWRWSRRLSTR